MDDDKQNSSENQPESPVKSEQPRPIFETTPVEVDTSSRVETPQTLQPEEVSSNVATPEEVVAPTGGPGEPPMYIEHKQSKNKLIFIGAAVLVFLLIFIFVIRAIFGAFGTKNQKEIKLVYWGLWNDREVIDPLIQEYQSKHKNIKIDYQKMDIQDYRDKLVARSKSAQGKSMVAAPDIFRFHNTWVPEIKEAVAPLPSSVMSNSEFEKTFYPVQKRDLKVGDYYYGIPLSIDGLVVVYNNSLFKRGGVETAPTTWEDLIATATKLTVQDKNTHQIITSGIALGTASNIEHFSDVFGLFLVQNGGDIAKLDQQEAADALEAYRKFAEPPSNVWDENMPNSITAFIQEKVAMIIVPSWEILAIKSANPDLDIKTAPIPILPGTSNKPISIASYWVEGVSKFSQNQLEAWKFLKFLSEKESLTKLYQNQSKTRLFGEAYSRVDMAPLLADNEHLKVVINQADTYISLPVISRTFDNGLNDEIIQYIRNAINATAEGVSYGPALSTAKDGVNQVLTKFSVKQ